MKNKFCFFLLIVLFLNFYTMQSFANDQINSFEKISDDYFSNVMSEKNIVGLGVSVVVDGRILFSKGYGYSDYKNGQMFNNDTKVQIASVSKVFVSTAVMQMVDEGKLNLDADVNQYLNGLIVNNPYDTPVTLRMLLTHTSGLDDQIPIYYSSDGDILFDKVDDLGYTLRKYLPPVVREPGTFYQYSVFGMSLAAYIVEQQSGMKFDEYIEKNIFSKIGMKNSCYGLKKEAFSNLSKPYYYGFGRIVEGNYTLLNDHPSGSILSTVEDMGNFIVENVKDVGLKLLSADSRNQIFSHQYPADSRLWGFGLGYMEVTRNGYRVYEHGGYLPSFTSKLSLNPKEKLGVFITYNTKTNIKDNICNEYIDKFYQYYLKRSPQESPQIAALDFNNKDINGKYSNTNYSVNDSTKIKRLIFNMAIRCDKYGNLTFRSPNGNIDFYYIGNGVFYNLEEGVYCKYNNRSKVISVFGTDYEKIDSYNIVLFYICMALCPFIFIIFIKNVLSLIKKRPRGLVTFSAGSSMGLTASICSYFGLHALMSFFYIAGKTDFVVTVILKVFTPVSIICLIFEILVLISIIFDGYKGKIHTKERIVQFYLCIAGLINLLFIFEMNGFDF